MHIEKSCIYMQKDSLRCVGFLHVAQAENILTFGLNMLK